MGRHLQHAGQGSVIRQSAMWMSVAIAFFAAILTAFEVAAYNGGSESLGGTYFNLDRASSIPEILPLAAIIAGCVLIMSLAFLVYLASGSSTTALMAAGIWIPIPLSGIVVYFVDIPRNAALALILGTPGLCVCLYSLWARRIAVRSGSNSFSA